MKLGVRVLIGGEGGGATGLKNFGLAQGHGVVNVVLQLQSNDVLRPQLSLRVSLGCVVRAVGR